MSSTYPIGQRIRSVTGLLEREDDYIHAKHYLAVLGFEDGTAALLAQNDIVKISDRPIDTEDLPAQFVDGKEDVVGGLITNAFILHRPDEKPSGVNGPQLFLVLDRERLMGIVPTQRGTRLHVENVLSSPLFRRDSTLTSLEGNPITMDKLVGF